MNGLGDWTTSRRMAPGLISRELMPADTASGVPECARGKAPAAKANVRYVSSERLGLNGNEGVQAWLERDCPQVPAATIAKLRHALKAYAPAYDRTVAILRRIMPRHLYGWLGHRFGRSRRSLA
jgi:hypothetical protein